MRFVLAFLIVLAAVAAWALHAGHVTVPPRWNPWAPLEIEAQPNWLTRYKLRQVASDPDLCSAVLSGSTLDHTALPDNDTGDGCGWQAAVRIDDARFAPAFTLTCPAAVSLAMWERNVLRSASQARFGQPVARVEHLGSYACRNVRGAGGEGARRSQHASANAFDVAGFRLADGRRIRVLNDWSGDGPQAAFLRDVHGGACRFFDGTLGPDYNVAHRDHFHLDRGAFRICR